MVGFSITIKGWTISGCPWCVFMIFCFHVMSWVSDWRAPTNSFNSPPVIPCSSPPCSLLQSLFLCAAAVPPPLLCCSFPPCYLLQPLPVLPSNQPMMRIFLSCQHHFFFSDAGVHWPTYCHLAADCI